MTGRRDREPSRRTATRARAAAASAGWNAISSRLVEAMVRTIVRRFSPEKVILFGSHAAGNAGPDSDVDLLVVMRVEDSKAERELAIRRAISSYAVPKDIIVTTPEAFAWRREIWGTIERPAALYGQVLYEKS